MKILIVNGPNLNLLGKREPEIYGEETMEECLKGLRTEYASCANVEYFQSNLEGELINRLQACLEDDTEGVLLNAGGYTHTSVALSDTIRLMPIPVIEIHLSNIHQREPYRHLSMLSAVCNGSIIGFGTDSYRLGMEALLKIKQRKTRE